MQTEAVSGKKKLPIQEYPDTCGWGLNEILPHFFHELKTKGFDVIGVNVFQEHFHVVVVQLRQRNVQKSEFRGEYNSVAKYRVKVAVWSPNEVKAKADTNVSEYYTFPAIYFSVL